MADEAVTPLRGDLIGLIVARFLNAKVVVTPVTSNSGAEEAGSYRVLRTKVGCSFVIEGFKRASNADDTKIIAFKANGSVLAQSEFVVANAAMTALQTRDSFLPVLAALVLAKQQGKPLSAIAKELCLLVAADRLEKSTVEDSAALMTNLRAAAENLGTFLALLGAVSSVGDIDGLRVTLAERAVIHLRPLGNEPEMRCYVEAENEVAASSLLRRGLSLVRDWAKKH